MNLTHKEDYFYSLNWLQFLIIALGIPYHTWTALNKNFYTFENLQNFNFFNINTIFWIMHILRSQTFMLLSGFFLAKSFSQISIKKNLIKKTKKLLLPFIFGYVCLQPIISSIRSVTFASLYHTNTDFFKELFYSYQKLYAGSLYFGIFWFLCFLYIYESIFIIFFKTISNFKNLKLALYLVLLTTITCSYLYNKSII